MVDVAFEKQGLERDPTFLKRIKSLSGESFSHLPEVNSWPKEIHNLEEAERVFKLFGQCEGISESIERQAYEEQTGGSNYEQRTSSPAHFIIKAIEEGYTVILEEININQIPNIKLRLIE